MPLPKELQDKWEEAKKTGKPIKLNGIVVCDICNEDYTNRPDSGGFVFGSYGYCPKCAKRSLPRIKSYDEEKYIKAFCPDNMSFADFIRDYRGPNDVIQIIKGI